MVDEQQQLRLSSTAASTAALLPHPPALQLQSERENGGEQLLRPTRPIQPQDNLVGPCWKSQRRQAVTAHDPLSAAVLPCLHRDYHLDAEKAAAKDLPGAAFKAMGAKADSEGLAAQLSLAHLPSLQRIFMRYTLWLSGAL